MNRTMLVGTGLIIVGLLTHTKFSNALHYSDVGASLGVFGLILGCFMLWNGWVANYNTDPSFAILG